MSASTEDVILEIYQRHLRRADLSLDDDFYDYGGHSLIAFRILAEFRRMFPVTPLLEDFEDLSTARVMAVWLRHQNVDEDEGSDGESDGFPLPAPETRAP